MGPQRPLGVFLERIGLMDASWSGLGDILERSWTALRPKKTNLERLLAAPRGIPREVSAILGAKRLPKVRPRGCKIEVRKRFKLKMLILQKPLFFSGFSLMFQVSGSLFGVKGGSKFGSGTHLRRISPQKASWRPLGALLEPLGAEKTNLESLLAALGGLLERFLKGQERFAGLKWVQDRSRWV